MTDSILRAYSHSTSIVTVPFTYTVPTAMSLLAGETNGIAIDATSDGGTVAVKDTTTPANDRNDVTPAASPLTQAGSSPKVVMRQDGLLYTVAAGQIAQEYINGRYAILNERAATNIVLYSEELDNAAWTAASFNVSITANNLQQCDLGATTAGVGSSKVMVWYNGSNWTVMGK